MERAKDTEAESSKLETFAVLAIFIVVINAARFLVRK